MCCPGASGRWVRADASVGGDRGLLGPGTERHSVRSTVGPAVGQLRVQDKHLVRHGPLMTPGVVPPERPLVGGTLIVPWPAPQRVLVAIAPRSGALGSSGPASAGEGCAGPVGGPGLREGPSPRPEEGRGRGPALLRTQGGGPATRR